MPTSPYFNSQSQSGATQERFMVEDLIIETLKIYGIDVYVIPRETNDTIDWVYGEDPLKKFSRNYGVAMYMNTPEGYAGAGGFFAKFGLEIRDDTTFIVPRRSFIRAVPTQFNRSGGGPREGDLIWCALTNTLFEIKSIEEERSFFALGNKRPYWFELSCERFRYNNEKFLSGIEKVDADIIQHSYLITFNLSASGNGKFIKYETIYQSNTPLSFVNQANVACLATVQEYNHNVSTLNVAHIKGSFIPGVPVWGANSNASYTLLSFNDQLDNRSDDIIDNSRLQTEGNTVIDFDPANPFGNP